ncbi:hypothetical protein ACROYT_G014334 [Oculina patagonica]
MLLRPSRRAWSARRALATKHNPEEGKKHDASMLCDSGLLQQLQWYARPPAGHPMCIYGDPAYPLRLQLQAPFRNVVLTAQMQALNSSMNSVRSCVEWLFGDIVNYFKLIDFKKNLKIGLSNIGKVQNVSDEDDDVDTSHVRKSIEATRSDVAAIKQQLQNVLINQSNILDTLTKWSSAPASSAPPTNPFFNLPPLLDLPFNPPMLSPDTGTPQLFCPSLQPTFQTLKSDAERKRLKFAVVSTTGLSYKKAKAKFGLSDIATTVFQVRQALDEVPAFHEAIENSAKVKDNKVQVRVRH